MGIRAYFKPCRGAWRARTLLESIFLSESLPDCRKVCSVVGDYRNVGRIERELFDHPDKELCNEIGLSGIESHRFMNVLSAGEVETIVEELDYRTRILLHIVT